MDQTEQFKQKINEDYTCQGGALVMGSAMLEGEGIPGELVKIPLNTLSRHGLIAGATGTGKKNLADHSRAIIRKWCSGVADGF